MRWMVAARIFGYLVLGTVTGLWLLSVHAYRGEWTIFDRMRAHREHSRPYHAMIDCGWRVLGCRDLPPLSGGLAAMAASELSANPPLYCSPDPFVRIRSGDSLVESAGAFCAVVFGEGAARDSALFLAIDPHGWVSQVGRILRMTPGSPPWNSVFERMDASYGPEVDCPTIPGHSPVHHWRVDSARSAIVTVYTDRLGIGYAETRTACDT